MRAPSPTPRPAVLAGAVAAVVLCWAGGLAARHDHLSLSDPPFRDDYLVATGSGLGFVGVLSLGLLALAVLRLPWWLLLATAAATAHHAVLAVSAYARAGSAPVDRTFGFGTVRDGLGDALRPGSWPLLVVVLAAAVALVRPPQAQPRRPLSRPARAGLAAAFLLAALSGLLGWYLDVYFRFEGEPQPADFQDAIVTAAGTAALLVVGVVVVRLRWGAWSAALPAALGVLVQGVVVAGCLDGAQGSPDPGLISPDRVEVLAGLEYAALLPTSWPLIAALALGVAAAAPARQRPAPTATGPSSPAPR